ncbi:MAG TPA: 3' terminal RNA ribose 2'-O-methyltransferase Hen1 [Pirellulales bacterium]|jgi:3' terminal RNA ribose 2'-O-methyltransferase Hen1|nr:3' terminal RNA ribose 2'-O-methyltransferase Hen1 [Pirellulales bacterium]
MLLTLTTTHCPATDLGFLLHKNPARCQSFPLSFGKAHVFYPEAETTRCTAALLLDVDPVAMVRGRSGFAQSGLAQYVNDRPYVASSFMSVAIAQILGPALDGRSKERPELATTPIPLTAKLEVLPCRGGEAFLFEVFQPLGYEVEAIRHALDEKFDEWGASPYYSVTLTKTTTVSELLTHLYVLIPVFDNFKHYYIGTDELAKLLKHGEGWLATHPQREAISYRYLKRQPSLARQAIARLAEHDEQPGEGLVENKIDSAEDSLEKPLSLNEQRLNAVAATLAESGARRVLDLGCGEGKLVRELLKQRQFDEILAMDVAVRALEIASNRLRLDDLPRRQKERIHLMHGSLMYRDKRLAGFDAAAVVEVIEHFDPSRLAAFERVLFEFASPKTVVVTTPNREYNVMWPSLPAGQFRHADHRFEWSRAEFQTWAKRVADQNGYAVRFLPIGPEDETVGAPTQLGLFERTASRVTIPAPARDE